MAEIAAGFLGPAIEVAKCVAAPIKRQFTYLCCFDSNIKSLRDEAKNLDDAEKGLQMQVDRARDNVQVIVPEVKTWLTKSKDIKDQTKGILSEVPNVESGLKLRARFSLSKRAKKTVDLMKELRDQCQFNTISEQGPPAASEAVPLGSTYDFESRKQIEEDIMTTLRKKDVNMIGICGMGGVGKTTMAKRIMSRVMEEHLFDEVVMVVISQQVDKLKIQHEIGGSLGLKLEGEAAQARVQKLRARLSGTRRILLVLDDVWRSLVLEDLGIPCEDGFRGCTVLLTSRNRDVLRAMNVQKVCGLQILFEGEAWFLFRQKTGTCVDDTRLNPTAKQVMEECKGLPIALAAVGVALRDENDISIWEDALRQLRKSNPSDIPNIITEVYNPLKLSYDFLADAEHAKSTFLLCCLFPEDADIPLEHLTYFAMGLRVFEGIWELEEARGRMRALIKMLKNRFLLLDGSDECHVRMHDVVRDVSIFIASKERRINCNDCTWISSFVDGRPRLPTESSFPNLHLLLLDNRVEQEFKINDSFIEGRTRELNVLFIKYGLLTSLPHTTQLANCLRTLVLYNCESLEAISAVGQFVSLEILICYGCDRVKEVPLEVRGLKHLKLLEILRCRNLKRVAPGVISSLVGLEELKIDGFEKWEVEVEGKERENAGLRELESLTNLRCLEIEVLDSTLAAVPMHLSPKLVKFSILFGASYIREPPPMIYRKKLLLEFSYKNIDLGDFSTNVFLRSTECLRAYGDGTNINWDLANAQSIRWLTVGWFKNMKNITTSTAGFPFLEFLSLEYLDNLEEIWDGPISSNSFKNLKELRLQSLPALKQLGKSPYHSNALPHFINLSSIYISKCPRLRHLFSSATAKDSLPQLEMIKIEHCDVMEQVVLLNEEDKDIGQASRATMFPKLKSLHINQLPRLMSFCKGVESIEFPLLSVMNFQHTSMKYFAHSEGGIGHEHCYDQDSVHMFCQPKVSFSNMKSLTMWPIYEKNAWCDQVPIGFFSGLEELRIWNYMKIRSFFSSSIAENLVSLQKLEVEYCVEMVTVIEGKDEGKDHVRDSTTKRCLFPRLEEIRLSGLDKLEIFSEWKCALELPSLRELSICSCPKMTSFSAGPLITPALQEITVDGEDLASVEDVNVALQQYVSQPKKSTRRKMVEVTHCGDMPHHYLFHRNQLGERW